MKLFEIYVKEHLVRKDRLNIYHFKRYKEKYIVCHIIRNQTI